MKKLILISSFILVQLLGYGQQVVNHNMNFASGLQNMWGPSYNAFTIDRNIPLFSESWNQSLNTGNGGITTILGQQFGAAMSGSFSGTIGSNFSLSGFSSGELEVEYPITTTLNMPTDLTYDQGDDVTILTNYVLDPGHKLETYYPKAGKIKLDLYFQMAAGLSATVCAFGCTNFPVIPNFNTGMQNINIFTIDTNEISFFSFNGSTPIHTENTFPLNTSTIPSDPLGQFGLNATLDLPDVTTTYAANGLDIIAKGESPYAKVKLDIFKLLGKIPGPQGVVLSNLSGSKSLGPFATVNWNFFSASLEVNVANKQTFDFDPKVYGRYQFPVPVEFEIIDPVNGTSTARDTSSLITCEVGNNLLYKFPCYFSDIEIEPTYFIDGIITNHTYDSISFDFLMSALAFGLTIPSITITPTINVPRICIPYPYYCGSWSNPGRFCIGQACTPAYVIPAVKSPAVNLNFGPLWSKSIPLGNIKYDWFKQTWSLEGFSEFTFPSFHMIANTLGASSVITDVDCFGGNNGTIDVSLTAVSPALPYTYIWTNGATSEDLTNLGGGPYTLTAYDDNGCEHVTGGTIIEPLQALTLSTSSIDKNCNGGLNDGSIDLFIQGGTAPYTVNWDNGATTEDLVNLNIGSYTATVTDARGCTKIISTQINQPNVLGQTAILTDVNCFSGNDGAIDATSFGGTLPHYFSWTNGATVLDIATLTAGNYDLTVTDAKGCVNTASYSINQPNNPLTLNTTQVDVLCKGDSTGSIDLNVTGGTAGYTFLWSNQMGVIIPFQSEDLSNLPTGLFEVSVVDAKGCTDTLNTTILEPLTPLGSNPILTNILCFGNATGLIDPQINGGTSSYTYLWNNGATSPIANNLTAGDYSLDITDINGCTETFNYTLTQPIDLVVDHTSVDVLCTGNQTGMASTTVSGGVGPYIYNWTTGQITPNISPLIAGTYTLNVTDNNGCIETEIVTIEEPLALVTSTFNTIDVNCFGQNTGEIDQTISGGTAPYTYLWSNSGSVVITATTEDINSLYSDTYFLTVTDDHGCVSNDTVLVNQPNAGIAISVNTVDVLCKGANTGEFDITVSGGTPGYFYAWSNGSSSEDINSLIAGNYTISVDDALGCNHTETFVVTEPGEAIQIELVTTHVGCKGDSTGFIESTVSGGIGPYNYTWSTGNTNTGIYLLDTGTYTLNVTDANGCIAFSGAVVNEPISIVDTLSTLLTNISCFERSDGVINISPTGGTAPYTVNWGDPNQNLYSEDNFIIDGLKANNYFVRIIDDNSCTKEMWITLTEPQLLTASDSIIDVLCYGDSTGGMFVNSNGGTQPYGILWEDGSTNFIQQNLFAGDYSYTVTDDHGCVTSNEVLVLEPEQRWYSGHVKELNCLKDDDASITLEVVGGVRPYLYKWSNGATDSTIESLVVGDYFVIVTDSNQCIDTLDFIIYPAIDTCTQFANTFTPNGDGQNDVWIIKGIENYPNAMVAIFNKWGNELYRTNGQYIPWNGTYKGVPLPSTSYYFIIEYNDNSTDPKTGVITIVR